jgi:hypothetical protein
VNFLSGSCEEIGECIHYGTIASVLKWLDCRREHLAASSTPGIG